MAGDPEYVIPRVRIDGPITLAEPDPAWARAYADRARQIHAALGSIALLVEHVGSTSVSGLVAKPIIDVVLVVPDAANEPSYVPALEAAGFRLRLREPNRQDHRLLDYPDSPTNLHVFPKGSAEVDRMLALRDWLRTHPADRDAYADAKRDLAARQWEWMQQYADAKSSVVEAILTRAASG